MMNIQNSTVLTVELLFTTYLTCRVDSGLPGPYAATRRAITTAQI
jgi:hypothetical protein